jgi:probable phosphoglycerate mutase
MDSERPRRHIYLVRHGETTYNVEGRLPGQLPDVPLTEEGRRQALRTAVALSATTLSAVVSSPLERARETAEIIARGWALPVRLDARLMDTDVGPWAGQKINDLRQHDPAWPAFVRHPTQPPPGIESLQSVLERSVAVIDELRHETGVGQNVVVVAHADVVKLIVAHYFQLDPGRIHFLHVDNGSVSALSFSGDDHPVLLALNWTAAPGWLGPLPVPAGPEQEGVRAAAGAERPPLEQTEPT